MEIKVTNQLHKLQQLQFLKKKHLTNMRQSNKDIEVRLNGIRQMSLDEAIEYLAEDELLEVTPQNFRIRKKILDTSTRMREMVKARRAAENNN